MTDEEKAAQQVEAEEQVSPEANADDKPEAQEESEESKQLKADLETERAARKKAEEAAADKAFQLREKNRNKEEDNDEVKEAPLTESRLQAILAEDRASVRKESQAQRIGEIAGNLSGNDIEKELILELHKSRNFPAHLSLEDQLEECHLIANKKRIYGQISELKRAVRGKAGATTDYSATQRTSTSGTGPGIPAAEAKAYASSGYAWSGKNKRFEKKLGNGDILTKKPGEAGTRVVKA